MCIRDRYHGGCMAYYMAALNVGQALVIMERFEAEAALRLLSLIHI